MRRGRYSAAVSRFAPIGACAIFCILLANCSNGGDPRYGVSASPRVVDDGEAVPKGGGVYRVGNPYIVAGRTYIPEYNPRYQATGLASWYGEDFHGRQHRKRRSLRSRQHLGGASDDAIAELRARDQSLQRPLAHRARQRSRTVSWRPHHRRLQERRAPARLPRSGTAWVRVEYVGRAPLEGSDDRVLAATLRQDEPAPPPSSVKLAATSIVPAAVSTSLDRRATLPSPVPPRATYPPAPVPCPMRQGPAGRDGTDQFLNGRGLY